MRSVRRRAAALGCGVLLVGAAATAAWAQDDQPGSDRYRLATATRGDVEQTLSLTGTIEHTSTADAAFATDGTVARVLVDEGDRVRTGQALALLDTTSLRAAVTAAEAALAQAKVQLETDQEAQSQVVEQATPTKPQPAPPSQPTKPGPAVADALRKLAAQQQAVRDAQTKVTEAIAVAKQALAAQQQVCTVTDEQPTPSADCDDALSAVRDAQDSVSTAQDTLQAAIAALTDTLTAAIAALSGQRTNSPAVARDDGSVVVPAVAMDFSDEPTVSAGTIAQDQASIDQARAALLAARATLASAVLRAPRAGIVTSADLSCGERVTAGTAVMTIEGKGRTTVSVAATVEQVRSLRVGQQAAVTVPGRRYDFDGEVTAIALLPSSGDTATTYPVTITLAKRVDLPTGSAASAAVVVATAHDVVTVPVSAVSDGSVRVMKAGRAVRTRVTVGVVGRTTIEVVGIDAGTRVVLADRTTALPDGQQLEFGGAFGDGGGRFTGSGGGPTVVRQPG